MFLEKFIRSNRKAFDSICEAHHVDTIYAFGSAITNRFNQESSDIDLLVSLVEDDSANKEALMESLWEDLEAFFGRKIDILTKESIRNPFYKELITRTRKLIYDREGEIME